MENNFEKSRNIRIFISSTFQDMQKERDLLVLKIFPALRKIASQRDVTLTEIDLRWGITEEEAQSSKVVEICMDEIQNSHPFFIGLLGNRYGWCPTKEELLKHNALPPRYEWVANDLEDGLSITEIEMQYGALRSKEPVYASFYIREEEELVQPDVRQERLKGIIRKNGQYPVYNYASLDELGEQVEQEFINLLNKLYPEGEEIDKPNRERILQQAYMRDKTRSYIADKAYLSFLDDFLKKQNEPCMVVTGESGMGKSSLLCYWLQRLQKEDTYNVIAHFPTNSLFESNPEEILEKLVMEIDSLYYITDMEETDKEIEGLKSGYGAGKEKLLVRAGIIRGQKPLVIVLDGINQYPEDGNQVKQMNWLPEFPENIKIIFSTIDDDVSLHTFRRRNYPVMKLYPLLLDQRRELITDFFAEYHKRLSDKQLQQILKGSNITDNTMVLVSLLEEIRSFGDFDRLSQFIEQMTGLTDYAAFFDCLLQRKEALYNTQKYPHLIEDFLSLILLSKDGLTETELLAISEIPALYWSQFFCANSLHFIFKNGRVCFAHTLIAQAVQQRYLASETGKEREVHLRERIIAYFDKEEPGGKRKMAELPYQFYKAAQWDNLFRFISTIGYLQQQIDGRNIHEFVFYWRTLQATDPVSYPITTYIDFITEYHGGEPFNVQKDSYMRDIYWQMFRRHFVHLVTICVNYLDDPETACEIIRFLQKMSQLNPREDNREEQISNHNAAGIINLKRKEYIKALKEFRQGLVIAIDLYGEEDVNITHMLSNIAEVYNCIGEEQEEIAPELFRKAELIFSKVLDMRLRQLGEKHTDVAVVYANLSSVYHSLGKKKEAEEYREKSLNIYITLNGENDIDVAIDYLNLANACLKDEEYGKAKEYAGKALKIDQTILGEYHSHTVDCYYLLAKIASQEQAYSDAIKYMERILHIQEKMEGGNVEFAGLQNRLFAYYLYNNQFEEAKEAARSAISLLEELQETKSILGATLYNNQGKLYLNLHEEDLSIDSYRQAISIWEQLGDIESMADSYSYLSWAYHTFLRLEDGLDAIKQTLRLLASCGLAISEKAAYANNNCGVLYYKLGDSESALQYMQNAYNIRIELFGETDEMAGQYQETISQLQQQLDAGITDFGKNQGRQQEELDPEEEPDDELEEFRRYGGDIAGLEELFIEGRWAFRTRNIERAIDLFTLAIHTCDKQEVDAYALVRSLLYRYLAYSYELGNKNEKAEEFYDKAADIAYMSDNDEIAQRVYKDMAEFFWNNNDFDGAEVSYWNELYHLIGSYGFYYEKTLQCINNISVAISKQEQKRWDIVLHSSALVYDFADEMGNVRDKYKEYSSNMINVALEQLESESSDFKPEDYRVDTIESFLVTLNYLIDIGRYRTAYQIFSIVLPSVSALKDSDIDKYATFYYYLMRLHLYRSQYHLVIHSYFRFYEEVESDAGLSPAIRNRMNLLLAQGYTLSIQYDKAIEIYHAETVKSNYDILLFAECLRATGRHQEALVLINDEKEKNEDMAKLCFYLLVYGKVLVGNSQPEEALELLQKYEEYCDESEVYQLKIYQAECLDLLNQKMEALSIIHAVMEQLHDWDELIIDKVKTYIDLILFMMKSLNFNEAEKLLENLDELVSEMDENAALPFIEKRNELMHTLTNRKQ